MKIYIRKGRCFKEVPDYIGMFYDGKHFTTELTDRSYAVCYDQRGTTCYLAEIDFDSRCFTFNDAIALKGTEIYNHHLSYPPTREQAMMAFSRCPILRTNDRTYRSLIYRYTWTQDSRLYNFAWILDWNDGEVRCVDKGENYRVRLFFEITIEV